MNILVTGGAGFIGSHTVVELIKNKHNVVIVDNFCNSKKSVIDRIEIITGIRPIVYEVDVRDEAELDKVFNYYHIDACIHFAGLKAVGESSKIPLTYYDNNISSTLSLLKVMKKHGCKNIVFSSSATVYGEFAPVPYTEDTEVGGTTNPYGTTKLFIEYILKDLYKSDNTWNIAILRYFNPIGAHESGLIGEDPNGIPNNLAPYITQVATGKLEYLRIFGNDYDTKDGTGVRDYIHVSDLAYGHVCALNKLNEKPGLVIYNLGTGIGYSVLDVLHSFEKAVGKKIPYKFVERRAGDLPCYFANPQKAYKEMHFKTKRSLDDMCRDQWKWQQYATKNNI